MFLSILIRMSISYSIDQQQQTVFTHVQGIIVGDDIFEQQDRLKSDPLFNPHMKELINCLEQENSVMNNADKMFTVANCPWGEHAKRAIIADTPLIIGLSRMFQLYMMGKHGDIEVFRNIDDARGWLGISETGRTCIT